MNLVLGKRASNGIGSLEHELPLKRRLRRYTHIEEPLAILAQKLVVPATTLSLFSASEIQIPPLPHAGEHVNTKSPERQALDRNTKLLPPLTNPGSNSSDTSFTPQNQTPERLNRVEEPRIWAKRRQGLCDALPYFKAHQGSLYTIDCLPLGLLIAKEARSRDNFDGQVIITTV